MREKAHHTVRRRALCYSSRLRSQRARSKSSGGAMYAQGRNAARGNYRAVDPGLPHEYSAGLEGTCNHIFTAKYSFAAVVAGGRERQETPLDKPKQCASMSILRRPRDHYSSSSSSSSSSSRSRSTSRSLVFLRHTRPPYAVFTCTGHRGWSGGCNRTVFPCLLGPKKRI